MIHDKRGFNLKWLAAIVLISGLLWFGNAQARETAVLPGSGDAFTLPAQQPGQPAVAGQQQEGDDGEDPEDPPVSVSTADHTQFDELQREFATGPDVTRACLTCHTEASKQLARDSALAMVVRLS